MNVYVMVDIEGISGVYTREQVTPDGSRFAEGRKYITEDVNACVKGLKAAGVDKIYVRDCHGGSYSFIWDQLSSDVEYFICGNTRDKRFLGIEDCDAVIFLGYHAMAGTQYAVLEHSWSSMHIQNIHINGKKVGEIAMDAAAAGEYGKPVIMISGDDLACKEAKEIMPNIVCAEVKKAANVIGAMLMPKEKAHKLIYDKAIEAVKNAENCKRFEFDKPLDVTVELSQRNMLPNSSRMPYTHVIDGRTYKVDADSTEQLIYRIVP